MDVACFAVSCCSSVPSFVSTAIALSILIHVAKYDGRGKDDYTTAAAVLGFVAGLAILALSYTEGSRAARPSTLLMDYILLQILFEAAITRTSWLVAQSNSALSLATLRTTSVAVKAGILVLEAQAKARSLQWGPKEHSPEETAGILSQGTYSWLNRLLLRGYRGNVSVMVPASQLTFIVGRVGSGKSTLCKAILGELAMTTGQVNMTPRQPAVGYCDQKLFLANSSVKENIIGYSQFNQQRYGEVTEACMLRPHFSQMVDGDSTKIGSNGIKLSGGQRQRGGLETWYLKGDFNSHSNYVKQSVIEG
ncbi:hypothetical protein ACJ41O_001371 [Fusarium nematophilum]